MQYLTIWDLILTPVYLLVLHYMGMRQRDKRYPPGHPLRRYFMPGLWVKFGGAIFIGLLYQFYYGGGDTLNFFDHSRIINSVLNDSISAWWKVLLRFSPTEHPEIYQYTSQLYWYNDPPSYTVAAIGAVLGLFNGTTYLPIALMFAYISYTGIWAMFRTFVNIYPQLHKPLAFAFLFVPSTFVWGSAIFKDTVCMFGLGWLTYTTFRIFVNRDFSVKNLFLLAVSFYLIAIIKLYILLAFLPALALWLLMTYSGKIQSVATKWIVNLFCIGIAIGGFLFFSQQYAKELNKYSLENIANTAKVTSRWINYVSEVQEGSGYDIGQLDGTVGNMLSKFPQGVAVTLFRPFIWEVKKPIMLLSAMESLIFLYLTIVVLIGHGNKSWKKIFSSPNLLFFFIYSIIFAFAVGVSTGNFGTLSRYKIPCMPFFAALLLILYYQRKKSIVNNPKTHAPNKYRTVPYLS